MVLSHVLGGGILHTCVLRPPGIYGPEEQRHLPRLAVCNLNFLTSRVFYDMGKKLKGASLICIINWLILLGSNSTIQLSAEDIITFLNKHFICKECRFKKPFFFKYKCMKIQLYDLMITVRFKPIHDISNVCLQATYTKWLKILMRRDTAKYLISSLNY